MVSVTMAKAISESGVPGYESGSWVGLLAPATTPAKIIARMSEVTMKAVAYPETRRRLEDQGAVPVGDTPQQFAARIRKEYEEARKIVKVADIKIE